MRIDNTEDYENFIAASQNQLAVIDFYADWCGPCRRYRPIFDAVASANPDVMFASLDVEALPDISQKYGVQGIPYTVFIYQGQTLTGESGLIVNTRLQQLVDENSPNQTE